jgi:hypothetical protein
MTTLSPDAATDAEQMQIEHLRRLPSWRKLALVGEMNRTVQTMALAGLRQRYPDDTTERRRRRLATLLLGVELASRVYGPGPEET